MSENNENAVNFKLLKLKKLLLATRTINEDLDHHSEILPNLYLCGMYV